MEKEEDLFNSLADLKSELILEVLHDQMDLILKNYKKGDAFSISEGVEGRGLYFRKCAEKVIEK